MIGWGLFVTFAALAYVYSWWFIFGVAVLALWKLNRWYYYSSRPWRKVHFPMMRAYAAASGLEAGQADREEREFSLNAALLNLLKMVNPKVSISHEALIQREFERCENFYDVGRGAGDRHVADGYIAPDLTSSPFVRPAKAQATNYKINEKQDLDTSRKLLGISKIAKVLLQNHWVAQR